MSEIIEEKEIPMEEECDADEYVPEPEQQQYLDAFHLLRAMKGHKLEDGGVIDSITVTFTDKKTKKKKVFKI